MLAEDAKRQKSGEVFLGRITASPLPIPASWGLWGALELRSFPCSGVQGTAPVEVGFGTYCGYKITILSITQWSNDIVLLSLTWPVLAQITEGKPKPQQVRLSLLSNPYYNHSM